MVDSFCDDMERALRDMHIPDATQSVTKAGTGFGYLIIDRGTLKLADLDGPMRDITGACTAALVKSMEIAMVDWQLRLFHHFCHVTMDLDPSTVDILVQPYDGMHDELEQAIAEHYASAGAWYTARDHWDRVRAATVVQALVRSYWDRKRAATVMQSLVRGFLGKPMDLTETSDDDC
jgi:hypothetical protein